MKSLAQSVLLAVACLMFVAVSANALDLVKAGKPCSQIVIAADAPEAVRNAAKDMVYHLQTMSGATIPIKTADKASETAAIWLGVVPKGMAQPSELRDPKVFWPDGYILISSGNKIIVLSPRPDGVSNGVYGILEDYLGCHWFSPEKWGEHIPRRKDVKLNLAAKTIVKPSFELRAPWYNGNAVPYTDVKKHSELNLWKIRNRGGGVIGYAGQEWFSFYSKDLQEKEPSIQALVNGKREPRGLEAQICISAQKAVDIAVERFNWVFREYPHYDYYTFSPNDNDNWCQCEDCKAMGANPAERVLTFTNKVAEAMAKTNPGKGITLLPYSSTIEPPIGSMKGASNLYPIICSYAMEQVKPKTLDIPWFTVYRQRVEKWMKILPRAWSYDYIGWYPGPWITFQNLEIEQNYYRNLGFTGMMPEYLDRNLGTDTYMWLSYKTSWDSKLKVKDLLDQFYPLYYGPAAKAVRAYHAALEKHMLSVGGTGEIMDVPGLYPDNLVEEGIALYTAASEQVAKNAVLSARINSDLECMQMLKKFKAFYNTNLLVTRLGQMDQRENAMQAGNKYLADLEQVKNTSTVGLAASNFVKNSLKSLDDPGSVFSKPGEFIYSDILDNGGKTFQAYKKSGYTAGIYGLSLSAGTSGELIYNMKAENGLKFADVRLSYMYFFLPAEGGNSVEVSLDNGTTWKIAYSNVDMKEQYAQRSITDLIQGSSQFLLKFAATNSSGSDFFVMDNLEIKGRLE